MTKHRRIIIFILLLDFCAIEFPGILFAGSLVKPTILGMPFLYGYLVLCWAFMCLILFYAWRTAWGTHQFKIRSKK